MRTACEVMFWQILPAVRREVARALAESGMKRSDVAKKLGITQAALTQYLKGKRGKRELPDWARTKIRKHVGKTECIDICAICSAIRKDPRFVELVPEVEGGCMNA